MAAGVPGGDFAVFLEGRGDAEFGIVQGADRTEAFDGEQVLGGGGLDHDVAVSSLWNGNLSGVYNKFRYILIIKHILVNM